MSCKFEDLGLHIAPEMLIYARERRLGWSEDMSGPKMRAKEAAEYLRVSVATLAKLRCAGGGPAYAKPSAKLVLYDRRDLDAWLSARMLNRTGAQFAPVGGEA